MSEFETADNSSPNDSSPGNSRGGGSRRPSWEWVPVVWQIAHRRLMQSQVRLLGLSLLVGLVAGLAAVVFYVTTVAAEHYLLGTIAGFQPEPRPGGETAAGLAARRSTRRFAPGCCWSFCRWADWSPAGSFTRSLPRPKGTGPTR